MCQRGLSSQVTSRRQLQAIYFIFYYSKMRNSAKCNRTCLTDRQCHCSKKQLKGANCVGRCNALSVRGLHVDVCCVDTIYIKMNYVYCVLRRILSPHVCVWTKSRTTLKGFRKYDSCPHFLGHGNDVDITHVHTSIRLHIKSKCFRRRRWSQTCELNRTGAREARELDVSDLLRRIAKSL